MKVEGRECLGGAEAWRYCGDKLEVTKEKLSANILVLKRIYIQTTECPTLSFTIHQSFSSRIRKNIKTRRTSFAATGPVPNLGP